MALAPAVETVLQVDLRALPRRRRSPGSCRSSGRSSRRRTGRGCSTCGARWRRENADGARLRRDARRPGLRLTSTPAAPPACRRSRSTGRAASSTTAGAAQYYMFTEADVLMCPLPMFHVFAAYPILMSCLMSGAQMVMPTPQGYRGEGVMDNFWKLVERHRVTLPDHRADGGGGADAAQGRRRRLDAAAGDHRLGGDAGRAVPPLRGGDRASRSSRATGMTEATCLVAINPPFGERKIGSVGMPVRLHRRADPAAATPTARCSRECARRRGRRDLREEPRRERRGLHRRRAQPRDDRRRRLSADRRPRAARRRRLPLDHRAGQGPDHPRRAQHRPGA